MRFAKILKSKIFIVFGTVFCVGLLLAQTIRIPEFKQVNSFELQSFENDVIQASANIGIQNQNWFSINGKKIEFYMFYNERVIAKGTSFESVKFNRKSISNFPIELKFYPDSLKNELKEILYRDSIETKIILSGKFTFWGIHIQKELKIWLKTEELVNTLVVKSMEGEGLKLKSVQLNKLELKQSSFDISFDFKNTINIPLELKHMNYSVYAEKLKQINVAEWESKINKVIAPNQTESIIGNVVINNISSALTGLTKVLKGKLDYFLDGYALIALKGREIKIPIKQHFLLEPLSQKITIIKDNE
jgi:LEA14-like dessication related protein